MWRFVALALSFFVHVAFAQPAPQLREVISEGYGREVPDAAQNAAQNALSQVVGSFMDASKILEKRTQILDGIRAETRQIRTDIKEYSQGSIQRFEILEVKQEQLVRVTARVVVRVEDFRAYVRKLAQAEARVDESLFAQMRTADHQNANAAALLHDNVIQPIASGQVVRFKVGPPVPFSQLNLPGNVELVRRHGTTSVVGFTVEASLDPAFLENMSRTLVSIAKARQEDVLHGGGKSGLHTLSGFDRAIDLPVAVQQETHDLEAQVASMRQGLPHLPDSQRLVNLRRAYTVYVLQDVRKKLSERSPIGAALTDGASRGSLNPLSLVVEVKDAGGNVLQRDRLGTTTVARSESLQAIQTVDAFGGYAFPWSLVGMIKPNITVPLIRPKASFLMLFAVNENALRNAASIVVRLAP